MNKFENRVRKFQNLMLEKKIDGCMIRTLPSFRYFTGVGWWQPSLYIPALDVPTIFAFEDEVEEIKEKTWIENVKGYRKVEELMKSVVKVIKESKAETLGFDLDIDASAALYQMFLYMHGDKKIVDVHNLIMELRMVKDLEEIQLIKKASEIAKEALKTALNSVKPGVTETEVAGEAVYKARKMGAESIHIYVNAGKPRIHAHPRNKKVNVGDTVMIDVMPQYEGYYSDKANTTFMEPIDKEKKKAYQAFQEALEECAESLKPELSMKDIEEKARKIYEKYDLIKYYVYGFGHGVGLRFEEDPITTIVVAHRLMKIKENMVLNLGHAPLSGKNLGAIKIEETYLVSKEGAGKLT
ncbi:aminopeptidase P family protein [Candidatus Bathyarchaeota archaeon]|nr:aminopeptidase P family protein [Candidatus Bathyarchaeota archaeon]